MIGRLGPGPDFEFDVAIRTATIDRHRGRLLYGVGSGITWDSVAAAEYAECRAKARVLSSIGEPSLRLFETIRVGGGRPLWVDSHVARLRASATALGFPMPVEPLDPIRAAVAHSRSATGRLRVLLDRRGGLATELSPLPPSAATRVRLRLALDPLPPATWQLGHKTTNRSIYDQLADPVRRLDPTLDDVLLWDQDRCITETTIANVAYLLDGRWWTPPADGRLLPGVLRGELVRRGRLRERPLRLEELGTVQSLVLLSALRGIRRAVIAGPLEPAAHPQFGLSRPMGVAPTAAVE
ncbi:MAG: aminotransferase class IV, partial [Phycisphaerales bacterium]|nr:aminotransferase class IV [Phycisphaerales bacterium]